jgi:hypothetical protein
MGQGNLPNASGKVAGAYRRLEVLKQARQLEIVAPELPTGPFQVIVADPPWRYESSADLPYPTMAIEDIKALPVAAIAADDALLWLWTTTAHLRVAFDVVQAWGFEYKTLLTWVKDRMGTGEWLRGQTEHCLLAARGKVIRTRHTYDRASSGTARALPKARRILYIGRGDMPWYEGGVIRAGATRQMVTSSATRQTGF